MSQLNGRIWYGLKQLFPTNPYFGW